MVFLLSFEVVRLNGTSRRVYDRHSGCRTEVPAEIIGKTHAPGLTLLFVSKPVLL
jgi:hypothetical protein